MITLSHTRKVTHYLVGLILRHTSMGGARISGKGVHMYKGVGVRFAEFISFFLNIP